MDNAPYDVTTGELANNSKTSLQTIIKYCDLGLLDHIRLRNGSRLLRRGQEDRGRAATQRAIVPLDLGHVTAGAWRECRRHGDKQ